MKIRIKSLVLLASAILALALGAAVGSADISVGDLMTVVAHKLFGAALPGGISPVTVSILWSIRIPRAVMAFLVGAALAASGTVM